MKKFCQSLREQVKNIFDFEKKNILLLTEDELKLHQDTKVCYICEKRILRKLAKNENCQKVRDHCHYTGRCREAAHSIFNLTLNMPN